jgi:glutamate-1-semialdehyde aminotransferase
MVIPTGAQTLSKAPSQFVDGVSPKFLRRGKGSHVWDVDGNEYIDYPMALGPILLGYDHPAVT